MIKIAKWRQNNSDIFLQKILNRSDIDFNFYYASVKSIIDEVLDKKDKAIIKFTEKFDNFRLNESNYYFTKDDFSWAYKSLDLKYKKILDKAAYRIEKYHSNQKLNSWFTYEDDGTILGQKITPIEKVALYVPGGKALYPSTVLMTGIPAKVAGVEKIFITSPIFDKDKSKLILAAAHLIGADKLYKVGGAQAVAAVAYGTDWIEKVDKVVGPGNIYVAVAKKLLFGVIDIDMIAGPSEILIIADSSANPEYIVADMFSQAEHDELASSILVTDNEELAEKVKNKIAVNLSKSRRKEILEKSLKNHGVIIITENIEESIDVANKIAPEHLEILTKEPFKILPKIKNAGAIFLGEYSPEPIGDYMAGPNHVLPTSGTAKFFSPLGVYDFYKRSSIISLSELCFNDLKQYVYDFANAEGLFSHAESVNVRNGDKNEGS